MTALSDWLHRLPAPKVRALREFRASARAAHPTEDNPMEAAFQNGEAPDIIAQMPREFVLALDH